MIRSSSSIEVMDEELTCELQCPVCLELLTWPIILPCSHVLCRDPCAERLFHNGFVRCPVCRDNSFVSGGITNLPRVIALEHIIERVQHRQTPALPAPDDSDVGAGWCGPDDIACQLCACEDTSGGEPPRKAVKSCLHCNASYCDRCLKMSHPGRAPFSEHKMVEPRKHTRPKELRCLDHDALMNIYCRDCQTLGCLLCADDAGIHAGHQVLSLRQTVEWLKSVLDDDLQKMELCMESMALSIAQFHTNMASLQRCVTERRSMIHEECDSLINEIENKKQFFLSDLEYEEKSKLASLSQQIEDRQQINATLHSLIYCAREVLQETDPVAFVQIAKSVVDKITKNSQKVTCGVLTPSPLPSPSLLNQKVVDFRKERAIIKDLSYLTVPNTPRIDVSKCFRSTSSVVLVLTSAEWDVNVIDGYTVYYSTSRDTKPDSWDLVDFKTPGETRKCGRGPQTDAAICLMHNNLECGMVYYFVVSAYNASGQSEMSEVTQCATLSASQTTLAVPQIVENQCRTYTYSIQLHSPSPLDDPPDSSISHYLLYREASVNKIWKSISLYGRVDHRVFGLEPNTLYDFVIMSCDKNSECQVSNMVTLQTERSAY